MTPVVAPQQTAVPGHVGVSHVQLRAPVELVLEQVREAPSRMVRAAVDGERDPRRLGRAEPEPPTRPPRCGQRLRHLRVERDVVAPAGREQLRPARRARRPLAAVAVVEHRRTGHPRDELTRALVAAGCAGVPVPRGGGVDQQQVRVGPRHRAHVSRDVRTHVGIPTRVHPQDDAVREREVLSVVERGGGLRGGRRPGQHGQQEQQRSRQAVSLRPETASTRTAPARRPAAGRPPAATAPRAAAGGRSPARTRRRTATRRTRTPG